SVAVGAGLDAYRTEPVTRARRGAVLAAWLPGEAGNGEGGVPASNAPSRPKLVDALQQDSLRSDLGADTLEALIASFWTDAGRLCDAIQEAAEAGDAEAVRRHLHTMKGVAETVGLVGVVPAVTAAGNAAKEGGPIDVAAIRAALVETRAAHEERWLGRADAPEENRTAA
ncbi:Hpt domain-containing protein, partial [Nostoc sp. NIES-2111]